VIAAKSYIAASKLGDAFSRLGWSRRGVCAMPLSDAALVAVQYRSDAFGCNRVVACDACRLLRWMSAHIGRCGSFADFLRVLDKKEEFHAPVQPELLPLSELAPAARRSMRPD